MTNPMPDSFSESCLRCKKEFSCHADHIAQCACNGLVIEPETSVFLQKTEYGCLCPNCLMAINEFVLAAQNDSFPTKREQMKEGLHYYLEGGYWVFTEFYHFLRGHCCKNGCRHCAYGFKK
jgi:hypothetical protein